MAALRVSLYVFYADYPHSPHTVLFQGQFGFLDKVDRTTATFLKLGDLSLERRSNWGVDATTFVRLLERGYVTDLSEREERERFILHAISLHHRLLDQDSPHFALIPTYECNLRCSYCFQDHTLHANEAKMTRDIIDKAFASIQEFTAQENKQPSYIQLWGGEPLLRKNRGTIEAILTRCRALRYPIKAITNGTELEAYSELLGIDGISMVQVTIDGPRPIHNQRRTDELGAPTFDKIVENVSLALDKGVQVDLRMNADRSNLDSLAWIGEFASSKGWTRNNKFRLQPANIAPTRQTHAASLISGAQLLRVLNNAQTGCNLFPESGRIDSLVKFCSSHGRLPLHNATYCSAMQHYYILDPFGDIYACENEAGVRHKRIGTFLSGQLVLDKSATAQWRGRTVANIPECSRCPAALLCGGGCAHSAEMVSGTYYASYCDGFKSVLANDLPPAFERHMTTHPV